MTSKVIDDCYVLDKDRTPHGEAIRILKSRVRPVTGTEQVPLAKAAGRFLAEPLVSPRPIPGHDNAAVDGYAFASTGYDPERGSAFAVTDQAAAGRPVEGPVPANGAVRIFTGAVMPRGLDTVVMQEDVRLEERDGSHWAFVPPGLKPGANRRLRGEDTRTGDVLVSPGTRLRPQEVASAAAAGLGSICCRSPLRVAVISTGDEILRPGEGFSEGKVYDANAPMLHGLTAATGVEVIDLGVVPDTIEHVRAALRDASRRADAVILSGGASQGQEDHVVSSLDSLGERYLWQIAIKPGRPMSFGRIGECLVLGLPGNPVAVFVCYLIYVHPVLTRLAGGAWPEPDRFPIPAAFSQKKKTGRREFWRARLIHKEGQVRVAKFPRDGSGLISSLREADGLIELGEDVAEVRAGEPVDFLPFSAFGLPPR